MKQVYYLFILICLFLVSSLSGDVVHFKSGLVVEGQIEDKGESIRITTSNGFLEVPKSVIKKIEKKETSLEELNVIAKKKKAKAARKENSNFTKAKEWYKLYKWSLKESYPIEKQKEVLLKVLELNPRHVWAQENLDKILATEAQEEEIGEEILIEEPETTPKIKRRLSPEAELESYVDSLYKVDYQLPFNRFAQRGGLNVLYNFIHAKAIQTGFSRSEAQRIANEYKNIAGVGGDRARDALRGVYFDIIRLNIYKNPYTYRKFYGNISHQPVKKDFFIFAISQAARAAAGGEPASRDFEDTYRLLYHKLHDNYYMGIQSSDAYRIAVKASAVVASGGGFRNFRRAFNFHFKQARIERDNRRIAVPYALREALEENKFPKRVYKKQ